MLLDTSGLLCCFDRDDARHVAAVITCDWIAAIVLSLLCDVSPAMGQPS